MSCKTTLVMPIHNIDMFSAANTSQCSLKASEIYGDFHRNVRGCWRFLVMSPTSAAG